MELFYELNNQRQAAATHYQLGSFYSTYLPLCQDRRYDSILEKSLLHYREAFQYYSKFDIGPTLLMILIDIADLYLSAYSTQEPHLKSKLFVVDQPIDHPNKNILTTNKPTIETKVALDKTNINNHIKPKSGEINEIESRSVDLNSINNETIDVEYNKNIKITSTTANESVGIVNESNEDSEVVISLLGGALQSLLESRFALTSVVMMQSKYRQQIHNLSIDIAKRLGIVLMKLLKAHAMGYLSYNHQNQPFIPQYTVSTNIPPIIEKKNEILSITSENNKDDIIIEGREINSNIISDNIGNIVNDKVLSDALASIKVICSELLRWSTTMNNSNITSTTDVILPSTTTFETSSNLNSKSYINTVVNKIQVEGKSDGIGSDSKTSDIDDSRGVTNNDAADYPTKVTIHSETISREATITVAIGGGGVTTSGGGGGGGGGVITVTGNTGTGVTSGGISVTRLYQIIEMLNQNIWLKRVCSF